MNTIRSGLETGRRLYGELVKGRTRVRIVSENTAPSDNPARFLLSTYRSGTTLMRFCLDSHPDLAVPPETDFLSPLFSVLDDVPSMTGFTDLGYEAGAVRQKLGCFARGFLDAYAATRDAGAGWLDKSPRYAERPVVLAEVYPDARFVLLHRHPLDQIHSFTRSGTFAHPALGGGSDGLELISAAADYWARVTEGLLAFAGTRPGSALSVRYEDLCASPEVVLRAVLKHLDLRWSDPVLEYHRHDHDIGREAGRVSGTRGFQISHGGWQSWPPTWVDTAWERTASAATKLEYKAP